VATGRATLIDVAAPFSSAAGAEAWLKGAGEAELEAELAVINRALYAFRLAAGDPYLCPLARHQLLVARLGYGLGEEVAEGRWTRASELVPPAPRQRRARVLAPQARLAAILGGRDRELLCEDLALRARLDADLGRWREAALQVMVALDAALAELPGDPAGTTLGERIDELRSERERVADAAQAALAGALEEPERETVEYVLGRIEATLRARAVAGERFHWRW
jgi:hypothetical protein